MRLHPTDTDRRRLIWPATANAEFRVIISVWVGPNAASTKLGYFCKGAEGRTRTCTGHPSRELQREFQFVLTRLLYPENYTGA